MPELIAGGPTIPVQLMNDLDGGKVVFFCGAGVSMGAGSGLPSFHGLVQSVYAAHGMHPDTVEKQSLENGALDKVLGLLERDNRLGSRALRKTVVELLSADPKGELSVHKAVMALSLNEMGLRLITTNFDGRFVEAGLHAKMVDAAPKLPVPKPHSWSGLVHLHGRIAEIEDGSSLVLTAADFGRAYLTEGWAARFVTELFREFTVVFVGYSIGDPVMSYMVDALAAERAKGAQFTTAYAFADCDGSESAKSSARDEWLAKNVEPITYDKRDDYRLLTDTLIEWSRLRRDPLHARSRIAIRGMAGMPAGHDDPVVERVVWALDDPVAAKALADEPPIMNAGEFVKLENWLDVFSEMGLLCCDTNNLEPSDPDQNPALVRLVDHGFRSEFPNNLDTTRIHLSVWLAHHLHVPQLLAWVLKNGGNLHPRLREEVQKRLAAKDSKIPERLRLFWTVLLDDRTVSSRTGLWISDQYATATSDAERRRIEDEVIASITPRLIVRPGPSPGLTFQRYLDESPQPLPPIDTCGHLRLMSGEDDARNAADEFMKDTAFLARYAETLTGYLELALSLGDEDDEVQANSIFYRPSIAPHLQNHDHNDWTYLIDLVQDSYQALMASQRKRAENLLLRWIESRPVLFRRLALNALTESPKADIRLAKKLLLAGRKPGLWELELRREVLRFFRLAGRRLPRDLRVAIVRAIHAGPKSTKGLGIFEDPERLHYEKALRLCKLQVSGAKLDKKSKALADEAEPCSGADDNERDEFLMWHGEVRWVDDEEFAPRDLVAGSVGDVVAALDERRVGQDGLRGLASMRRVKVASALRRLAQQGKWPAIYWQGFLWHLGEPGEPKAQFAKLRDHVAGVLTAAPDRLFKEVGSAFASFVKRLAEEYGADREGEFRVLWTKTWAGAEEPESKTADMGDPLTDALNHPAGKLAEGAMTRLQKYEPVASAGIPEEVRPYFDAIGQGSGGHLGRVMLMTQLHYLFMIDGDWVAKHLIARLSPARSEEASNLWSAYGWFPRLGPDLLRAFKAPFLEILQFRQPEEQKLGRLTSLFITVCLEAPDELTEEEIQGVVNAFPESGLTAVLGSLTRRLTGETAERARIWHERVHPWLRSYWPRAGARNTAATAEATLEMIAESGDAFPAAAEWSLEFLRPFSGRGPYLLKRNGHAARHPEPTLRVLVALVSGDVLESYERHTLREALNALVAAKADLASDPRFLKLHKIATK